MLEDNFFLTRSKQCSDNRVEAMLEIIASHRIFEGHFPGQPVVPGVCMIQVVKELLEMELVAKTRLMSASQVKFLAVINPVESPVVQATLDYKATAGGDIQVTASLFNKEVIYFKMSACFTLLKKPG